MKDKLTPKRRRFVNAIVEGMDPSAAYAHAGYSIRMGKKAVSVEAQKLLHVPSVSLAIEKALTEAARNAEWSRETALERLFDVNTASYDQIRKHGLTRDAAIALRAFIETADRLNAMTDMDGGREDVPRFYFSREEIEKEKGR